jgi:hypothetical protein
MQPRDAQRHRPCAHCRRAAAAALPGGRRSCCWRDILLWSFLPGTIARAMPESWHWPERMAARMVGASSRWDAGARLMQSDSPEAWNALVQAADIQRDNRDAIDACRKSAATSRSRFDAPSGFVRRNSQRADDGISQVELASQQGPTRLTTTHTKCGNQCGIAFFRNSTLSCKNNTIKWLTGAQKRTRTSTPLRAPAPEAGASTNSAIWARGRRRA